MQGLVPELGEGEIDHGAHGFGAIALAPVFDAEPVADIRRGLVLHGDAAGADRHAVAHRDQEGDLAARHVPAAMKSSASARE